MRSPESSSTSLTAVASLFVILKVSPPAPKSVLFSSHPCADVIVTVAT